MTDDSGSIAPLITARKTCIVLIQNGVGIEAAHRTRFPTNPIVSAVTVISAEQLRHGLVRQNRWTRISMGPYTDGLASSSSSSSPDLDDLRTRSDACMHDLARIFNSLGGLRDAEPHTELELQQIRWHKLCINAAMNPSAVLSGGRGNADMASSDPELRAHLKGIMDEIFAAAPRVLGAPFPENLATPEKILASTERNTGGKPSMLLDWEAGRPLEIEVILGLPVRIARERGVEMPRLQTVYALLRSAQWMRDEGRRKKKEEEEKAKGEAKL